MLSKEYYLAQIEIELRRVAGLPVIAGAAAPPGAEFSLANIYQIVANWSPSGDGGIDPAAPGDLVLYGEDNATTYTLLEWSLENEVVIGGDPNSALLVIDPWGDGAIYFAGEEYGSVNFILSSHPRADMFTNNRTDLHGDGITLWSDQATEGNPFQTTNTMRFRPSFWDGAGVQASSIVMFGLAEAGPVVGLHTQLSIPGGETGVVTKVSSDGQLHVDPNGSFSAPAIRLKSAVDIREASAKFTLPSSDPSAAGALFTMDSAGLAAALAAGARYVLISDG